ncbi:hypothetical protein [Mesorhizobium huakuii]|uniref:Uncharacterized protein n=1 Tax=Mesorhizobium huakuii TaxID=28104 RepID=A0ABZ0VS88_9HYPH|nr:hypothetical protein [Mesorhizobium huakuii]WQC00340.1 hypothetical protein U0R22_004542 [Mesorhizobium huakuii]
MQKEFIDNFTDINTISMSYSSHRRKSVLDKLRAAAPDAIHAEARHWTGPDDHQHLLLTERPAFPPGINRHLIKTRLWIFTPHSAGPAKIH